MTTILPLYLLKGGSLKKRLLVYFFTHPDTEHYLREIAILLGADPANLSRDLERLEGEGVFRSRRQGNLRYFSLNKTYALYDEMQSIIEKTAPSGFISPETTGKKVYVIAGPNGAGKTTFARTFLPGYLDCKVFINADLIAGGIAPLAPDQAAIKAGRLLLDEIQQAAKRGTDFGFETTLSGRSHANLFRELARTGYAIHLFFLWIPNIEISLRRIAERVRRGGHYIPEPVARRRFHRGIENLFGLYDTLVSSWAIFDNSGPESRTIAYRTKTKETVPVDREAFSKIRKAAGAS